MADKGWSERRRRHVLASSAALISGLVLSAGGAGAVPDDTIAQFDEPVPAGDRVAVSGAGGSTPSVSGDGRFVVFDAPPTAEADQRSSTVYVIDRETNETTELTPIPDGGRPGDSVLPAISGDGCSVVAISELQLDVFRDDDTASRWDVYRSTLPHCGGEIGDWELVSSRLGSGGIARDDVVLQTPAISRSGTTVAYTHPADHLFDAAGVTTISLVDLTVPIDDALRTRFVAGSPADSATDTYLHRGLDQPAISADGRFVAYRSDATSSEAVPGWAPGPADGEFGIAQVFVWDTTDGDPFTAVSIVSMRPDGTPSGGAGEPDISRDGTVVVFTSGDPLLTEATSPDCDANCPTQVFVVDRDADDDRRVDPAGETTIRIVSATSEEGSLVAGNGPSNQPSLSGDGHLVAFVTRAPDLQLIEVPATGSGDDGDLLLAELHDGRLSRLTTESDGIVPTVGVHAHPDLSDSGRVAVFDTGAAAALLDDEAATDRRVVARVSEPQLSLADADTGTTQVGLRSDEWYVAVINDGPSSFEPASVEVTDDRFTINSASAQNTCALATTVPPGGSCTVAVSFTPNAPGTVSAELIVAEAGFGAVSVSSNVSGAGGEPALRIDPGGADLGLVTVGSSSVEFQFDLSNIGFGYTEVTGFETTGRDASDFSVTSNSCESRPLNPRASCSVGVTFTPSNSGRRTALLEVATIDGQYTTVVLAGDGEFEPVMELATDTVRVGEELIATGIQYPANTDVTIVFGDGPDGAVVVTTDEWGTFEVAVPVDESTRRGDRTVVVQTTSGAAASAPVEIVEAGDSFIGMPGFGLG